MFDPIVMIGIVWLVVMAVAIVQMIMMVGSDRLATMIMVQTFKNVMLHSS